MTRGLALVAVTAGLFAAALLAPVPQPARAQTTVRAPTPRLTRALSIPSPVCTVAGWLSGLAGTLCSVARKGGELLSAGGKLAGGASTAAKVIGVGAILTGITAWVTGAGHVALAATATVIGDSTRPQLQSSWFSASYWRMAAIGMLLTMPFLFAACVQGLLRSDPSLIGRAALGYLPLSVLGISIAAPLTTLLLSASDGLSTLIAGAAGEAPGAALGKLGFGTGLLAGASRSTFIVLVIGFVTVAAALTLWVELLIRAAAVYVIVLMLPVVFAALVWPARRVWAIRSVETLVALILAKFAIVAVLSLGGAAIGQGVFHRWGALVGVTLVILAAFSPWALLRLLPLHEMAAGVEGLSPQLSRRMPMLDRPAPQSPSDAAAAQDSPRDVAAVDPARLAVEGLDNGGPPAGAGATAAPASAGEDAGPAGRPEAAGTAPKETRAKALDAVAATSAPTGHANPADLTPAGPDRTPVTGDAADTGQRLPGMGPIWQRRNGDWPTLILGPASAEHPTGSEPAPEAPAALLEAVMAPDAPHPLAPLDPPPPSPPDAGQR